MMQTWTRLMASTLVAATCTLGAAHAAAQDHSLDEYLEVQADAEAAYATLNAMDRADPGYHEAATDALVRRTRLVGYLSEWIRSGTMPDEMVVSARETRIVLYQNIVRIYADLGRCDDASSTLRTMDRLLEDDANASEIAFDALTEARTTSATCVVAEQPVVTYQEPDPEPVEEPAPEPTPDVDEDPEVPPESVAATTDGDEASSETSAAPIAGGLGDQRNRKRRTERNAWGYAGVAVGIIVAVGAPSAGGFVVGAGLAGMGLYYVLTPPPETGSVLSVGAVEFTPVIGPQSVGVYGTF